MKKNEKILLSGFYHDEKDELHWVEIMAWLTKWLVNVVSNLKMIGCFLLLWARAYFKE